MELTIEQKKELVNKLYEAMKPVAEKIIEIYEEIKQVVVDIVNTFWKWCRELLETYLIKNKTKIDKYIAIAKRTKNKRIKKKQLVLIRMLIEQVR